MISLDDVPEYMSYFDMQKRPFAQDLPHEALFQSNQIKDTLGRLAFAARECKFTVLTGPVGIGKSTVLRAFAQSLNPEQFLYIYISESNLTPRWLYTVPLKQLGLPTKYYCNDVKKQFHKFLTTKIKIEKKRVVMIIDEAHLINGGHRVDTLEEIRFLLNNNFDSGNPLTLSLCGQDELWDLLNNDLCKAITQRIDICARLDALDLYDVSRYIQAHMSYSKSRPEVFSAEAIEASAHVSGGIPRIINKICLHTLLYASSHNQKCITADIVKHTVATELPKSVLNI